MGFVRRTRAFVARVREEVESVKRGFVSSVSSVSSVSRLYIYIYNMYILYVYIYIYIYIYI